MYPICDGFADRIVGILNANILKETEGGETR